jgi:hypothetical protein
MVALNWKNITKEELTALYAAKSLEEIGDLYGRGNEAVRNKMIKFGIARDRVRRRFNPTPDEMRGLYQTMTMKQMAEHYGVGETVVWNRLKEHGIGLEGSGPYGHRHDPRPHSLEAKERMSQAHLGKRQGADNPNWRGGAALKHYRLRQSAPYRRWKEASLERANFQCQDCGVKHQSPCGCCGTSITLHVHHLHSFSRYPEIRFDPENSEVLCPKCHHSRHRGKIG